MRPLLLSYRSHPHATAALEWSAEVCRSLGHRLVIVNVFEPPFSEMPPDWLADLTMQRTAEIRDQVGEANGDDNVEIVVLEGSPMSTFADYARTHTPWLCVVGNEGSDGPSLFRSPGPAHALIHNLDSPLAVIRPGFEHLDGGTLVVGVDGSAANAAALAWCNDLAALTGSRVVPVFAFDPIDETFALPEGWHRHSEEVRAEVATSAGSTDLIMEAGHPVEVLMRVAEREHAAAIVVGTRGRGGFHGLRVGRVPTQLVDHAPCPVIVVPHDPNP